ncbi:MAG TPA: hypothetical protein VNL14_23750 [Candidatus Acidoferrales bacterium]|nr:hypothetical protein [Candidatus Acidoferrales bacterium]
MNLQKKGKPVVTVLTDEFAALAHAEREALGAPGHPLVIVPHPVGSLSAEEARARAERGLPELLDAVMASSPSGVEKGRR